MADGGTHRVQRFATGDHAATRGSSVDHLPRWAISGSCDHWMPRAKCRHSLRAIRQAADLLRLFPNLHSRRRHLNVKQLATRLPASCEISIAPLPATVEAMAYGP